MHDVAGDERNGSFADLTRGAAKRSFNVIYAVMMHDIKNRFFGSGLGQIVMVLWPFTHILVLIVIYVVTNRPHPYGDSIIQYSVVSIFPFIIFNYVGRWIVMSAFQNKPFLNYPIIRPFDLLLGRTILEVIGTSIVAFLLILLLIVCGSDPMPPHPDMAVEAIFTTIFLAIGFGFFFAPFAFITPMMPFIVSLVLVLAYVSSGILYVTSFLPEAIRYPLSFNPLLHCVEWMRLSYYTDYPSDVLDRIYVLSVALVMTSIGLVLLRGLRRFY